MAKKKELVAGAQSKWDGRLLTLIGTYLLMVLVLAIFVGAGVGIAVAIGAFAENAETLMLVLGIVAIAVLGLIGWCWALVIFIKWDTKHMVVSGQRLRFTASTINLFFNILKWTFLSVITAGIYALWLPIKVRKWQVKHMVSSPEEDDYGYAQPEVNYYYDEE